MMCRSWVQAVLFFRLNVSHDTLWSSHDYNNSLSASWLNSVAIRVQVIIWQVSVVIVSPYPALVCLGFTLCPKPVLVARYKESPLQFVPVPPLPLRRGWCEVAGYVTNTQTEREALAPNYRKGKVPRKEPHSPDTVLPTNPLYSTHPYYYLSVVLTNNGTWIW